MKKFLALICMITCIFGLTACTGETQYTEREQQNMNNATAYASGDVLSLMVSFMDDEMCADVQQYTNEEVAAMYYSTMSYYGAVYTEADGYAVKTGAISFNSAKNEVGEIVKIGEAEAKIDGDQIIVIVQVEGEKKNAEAEVILSNDMFLKLESVALNPISDMSELMMKAALNTLIGVGTVFVVLILISAIISAFSIIPKIQAKFAGKEVTPAPAKAPAAPAPAPVVEEAVELTDDLELVAVIAAAIAAYEGEASTDGFVVRSIRKVNRSRR